MVERQVDYPRNDDDAPLMQVLVDQMSLAPRRDTYLPISNDRALSQVLEALHLAPTLAGLNPDASSRPGLRLGRQLPTSTSPND